MKSWLVYLCCVYACLALVLFLLAATRNAPPADNNAVNWKPWKSMKKGNPNATVKVVPPGAAPSPQPSARSTTAVPLAANEPTTTTEPSSIATGTSSSDRDAKTEPAQGQFPSDMYKPEEQKTTQDEPASTKFEPPTVPPAPAPLEADSSSFDSSNANSQPPQHEQWVRQQQQQQQQQYSQYQNPYQQQQNLYQQQQYQPPQYGQYQQQQEPPMQQQYPNQQYQNSNNNNQGQNPYETFQQGFQQQQQQYSPYQQQQQQTFGQYQQQQQFGQYQQQQQQYGQFQPKEQVPFKGIIFEMKGSDSLEEIQSQFTPALIKFDPPNCGPACAALEPFMDMASHYYANKIPFWRLTCDDYLDVCQQLGDLSRMNEPWFAAWTNASPTGGWTLEPYRGPKSVDGLVAWLQTIEQAAALSTMQEPYRKTQPTFSGSESTRTATKSTTAAKSRRQAKKQYYGEITEETKSTLMMEPLAVAAFEGNLDLVQDLLDEPFNDKTVLLEVRNRNGATPLALAVHAGHVNIVRALLEAGAQVDTQDLHGTTPLLAAVLLGHSEIVQELLRRSFNRPGASIRTATLNYAFSLSNLAKAHGHNDIAQIIEERMNVFDVLEHRVHPNRMVDDVESDDYGQVLLPLGMEVRTCPRTVDFARARCQLMVCSGDMPQLDANDFDCEPDFPCPMVPTGKFVLRIIDLLIQHGTPTYRLTMPAIFEAQARQVTLPIAASCAARTVGMDGTPLDVWPCLFGQADFTPTIDPYSCDCQGRKASNRDIAAVLTAAILLQGNRTSPLLADGPTLPPYGQLEDPKEVGITVSVHVRAGDSCDVITTAANGSSWAFWPFNPEASYGIDYTNAKRFCVHPSVHLSAVKALHVSNQYFPNKRGVRRVLLATDSEEAVTLFREQLSHFDIDVEVLSFDREPFTVLPTDPVSVGSAGLSKENYWIEHRMARNATLAATVTTTALEDLRHLARGSVLIAAMSGYFARLIYSTMVAHNEKEIPVISVDKYRQECSESGLQYG